MSDRPIPPPAPTDQRAFANMLRSLFNIDGYQLPELTSEQQLAFVRDPVRYFIRAGKAQQDGEIEFQCRVCGCWTEWPADIFDYDPDAHENLCGGSPRCCP